MSGNYYKEMKKRRTVILTDKEIILSNKCHSIQHDKLFTTTCHPEFISGSRK